MIYQIISLFSHKGICNLKMIRKYIQQKYFFIDCIVSYINKNSHETYILQIINYLIKIIIYK